MGTNKGKKGGPFSGLFGRGRAIRAEQDRRRQADTSGSDAASSAMIFGATSGAYDSDRTHGHDGSKSHHDGGHHSHYGGSDHHSSSYDSGGGGGGGGD